MNELEGRIGIVTGASSGIGYAIANVLAESGAVVYAISRTGAVKEGLPPSAGGVIHVKGDVTNAGEMNASISSIAADSGLDFIVNNAGITKKHRAQQFPIEEFRDIMGEFPLIVGAGLAAQTAGQQLSVGDGAIVGSTLKDTRTAEGDVCSAYVEEFMAQVKQLREGH